MSIMSLYIYNIQLSPEISVKDWVHSNMLKLNPDKTEFIAIGTLEDLTKFQHLFPVTILENNIEAIDYVQNLSVMFDHKSSMTKHISYIVKSSYYHEKPW